MKTLVLVTFALVPAVGIIQADSLALVAADASGFVSGTQAALQATGKFTQVDIIDAHLGTPTLDMLRPYTDVLAWTDLFPADGTALGNVLADFYDIGGKHLTIATYALTNPGGINGRIATGNYVALAPTTVVANPSGSLASFAAGDPILSGIALGSVTYYHDGGFANAPLSSGANLIATDGAGINMISRSANGVVDINLYPGLGAGFGGVDNNDAFYSLLANTFAPLDPPLAPPTAIPGGPYSFCPQSKPWLLNGSQSVDPEQGLSDPGKPADQIIQYAWDFNGANTFAGASGVQPDVTALFTNLGPGIYPVQLRVTSSTSTSFPSSGLPNLTGTASTQVTVKNSCTCITALTAASTPYGQVQLAWPLTGSNHYNIYRSTVSGSSYALVATTASATYLDKTATPGTTYYYIVREANLLNEETCQSNEAAATPIADTIPPTTTAVVTPLPNSQGWNKSNVTVALNSADNPGGSGVKQISVTWNGARTGSQTMPGNTVSISLTMEGVTTLTYSAVDNAGNTEASKTLAVMIDKTPPAVTSTLSPPPNAYGWNNSSVTVTFTGTDTLSGTQSCTPPVTMHSEGANQVVTGSCTDNAGNVSAPLTKTVNIDWTPPVISGVPAQGKCVLWPPDHKLVTVATLSVSDAATFEVTGSSNDHDKDSDIVITGTGLQPRIVQLRAERSGQDADPVYTIKAMASNHAGLHVTDTFTCVVPHDQGK